MPDFARYKPSERRPAERRRPERRRIARGDPKTHTNKIIPSSGETRGVRGSGERPVSVFRKLLRDFHNGVLALQGISKQSSDRSTRTSEVKERRDFIAGLPPSHRDYQISERVPKLTSGITSQTLWRQRPRMTPRFQDWPQPGSNQLVQFKRSLGSTREALPVPALRPVVASSLNAMPNVALKQTLPGRKISSGRDTATHYHTRTLGADREAQHQVLSGEYTGSVHHLPSAARLAQILRTESLIRSGDAQPNGMIFALAQAIREGRRREVADLNPEVVQSAMFASLGGSTRAKQLLNIPLTHGLITRHQIALEALQRDLRAVSYESSKRARADFLGGGATRVRAGHARAEQVSRAPKFMPVSPSLVSAAAHFHSNAGGVARSNPEMHVDANLRDMMTVNELPHLNEVAMSERERLQSSGTRSEFTPYIRRLPSSPGSNDQTFMGPGGTRSSIAAAIDAPRPQPHVSAQAQGQAQAQQSAGGAQQARRPQKLKGTLQLRGHNNQLLGVAELQDGEITNG